MKTQGIVLTACLLSATAIGAPQDSVSKAAGLPGDAVDPYATGEQLNSYVVDMAPLTTSWGTMFGIAPVAKSGTGDATFFNNSISGQAASATLLTEVATPQSTYSLWTNAPGAGVNDSGSINDPGTPIVSPIATSQVAGAFAEFHGLGGNHVVTTLVNYNPINPSRLLISRVQAAVNGDQIFENNAQIGFGSVDAHGNTYIRADDFGTVGSSPIVGNNYYRVDAANRNPAIRNELLGTGPSDGPATDHILNGSLTTHNPTGNIPEDIAGRPVLIGSNFSGQFVYESSAGSLTNTSTHLGTASDHRGNVFFSKATVFAGSVGTAAMYGQDGAGDTRLLKIWGVNANGAVTGNTTFSQPASITDNNTGFVFPDDLSALTAPTIGEYGQYLSQVAFRGSNGQVGVGEDQAGRILVAAVGIADEAAGNLYAEQDNPINAMFVARFSPSNIAGTLEWTVAAYNDAPGGKQILDGPGGTPIGQIVELQQVTGGAPIGPSMSPPMIDSVGNIYFLAAVELYGTPFSDFDSALVRAVYNPASFSYELELVMQPGDVFAGVNSGRDYQISFLGIADSNSLATSAPFSGNIVQTGFNGMDVSAMATSDATTLGGLFINAEITYDWDDDGTFDAAAGSDQEYQTLLYIGVNQAQCSSAVTNYCTAGTSASGCQATITAVGTPSATASSGFNVTVANVEGQKDGLFFFGQNGQQANPWGNGSSFQCVTPPVKRAGLIPGNGTNGACDGSATQDLNARWCGICPKPNHQPIPGTPMQIQFWYRDPMNTSNQTTSFSDALEVTICP